MSKFDIHYGKNYSLQNIPITSDFDELVYIINYCLQSQLYQKLEGKYCGDKANNLLIKWGFKSTLYEIF